MKLHLGCGQRYLQGYVNIDFPHGFHSVQDESVADIHADILDLGYTAESIDEIRLHHVFEHFPRPIACGLLAGWYSWLKPGGILRIEVPDFQKTSAVILSPFSSFKKKAVAERHLFGSHEANWAVHCEGYTQRLLNKMLESFGFEVIRTKKNSWFGTYNFEVFALKQGKKISTNEFEEVASTFLANFLLIKQGSEAKLFQVWMDTYRNQLKKMLK